MDQKIKFILDNLENYKDRLSLALKIADISIFEVDLNKQLYTYIDNSEGIFEKKSTDILTEVNAFHSLPWSEYIKAVSEYFMYPEDIDLTRRIHEHYRTVMYPAVEITHNHAQGSYHSSRLLWIHITNMIKYFIKWGLKR